MNVLLYGKNKDASAWRLCMLTLSFFTTYNHEDVCLQHRVSQNALKAKKGKTSVFPHEICRVDILQENGVAQCLQTVQIAPEAS